jgi:hypothetical protein
MSRITRIQTKQGHPVPRTALPPRGPFPSELYTSQPVVETYVGISGNGSPEVPAEGTAQNNFTPYKWYRCKLCSELVRQDALADHICNEEEEEIDEF